MKKLGLALILISLMVGFFAWQKEEISSPTPVVEKKPSPTAKPKTSVKSTASIFVPYWTDWQSGLTVDEYDRIIFFGLTASEDGVNKNEAGYKKLADFSNFVPQNKEKWLALQLTNAEVNFSILDNQSSWSKISQQAIDEAKKNNFGGLVLDLEMTAISSDELVKKITDFVNFFYSKTKEQNLKLALTIYGDTFYRQRPFDIENLSQSADEIMIMAYDFHKTLGQPGPNFPLAKNGRYPYDLKTMVEEFFQFIPAEKLTVIFGLFGYDWLVDEVARPISRAKALTYHQIKDKFLDSCNWQNCLVKKDELSAETEVNYVDENLNYHIVWFEDKQSVEAKMDFLKKRGISSFAYWAYGYF